jgi:hypothetical protein
MNPSPFLQVVVGWFVKMTSGEKTPEGYSRIVPDPTCRFTRVQAFFVGIRFQSLGRRIFPENSRKTDGGKFGCGRPFPPNKMSESSSLHEGFLKKYRQISKKGLAFHH